MTPKSRRRRPDFVGFLRIAPRATPPPARCCGRFSQWLLYTLALMLRGSAWAPLGRGGRIVQGQSQDRDDEAARLRRLANSVSQRRSPAIALGRHSGDRGMRERNIKIQQRLDRPNAVTSRRSPAWRSSALLQNNAHTRLAIAK
jgi:hypothetical protein